MALDLAKWVWKVLNLLAAGLLAASGCALLYYHTNLNTIISGIVVVVFSLLLIMIEFWVPERLEEYAKFLFVNSGRGISLIILGGLTVERSFWLYILSCTFAILLGLIYIVTGFIPQRDQTVGSY